MKKTSVYWMNKLAKNSDEIGKILKKHNINLNDPKDYNEAIEQLYDIGETEDYLKILKLDADKKYYFYKAMDDDRTREIGNVRKKQGRKINSKFL